MHAVTGNRLNLNYRGLFSRLNTEHGIFGKFDNHHAECILITCIILELHLVTHCISAGRRYRLKRPLRLALSSILTLSILYNVLGCM
jgi:hypothetical protein